jgi:hypothetical protein
MALQEAIDHYHELLGDAALAGETAGQLQDQMHRRGLYFGARPLCSVLRPRFLTEMQYRYLQTRTRVLLPAFARAHDAAMADPAFRAQFRLEDWEER